MRVIARQVREQNCLAAIFAPRHQSVSSGPLGRKHGLTSLFKEVRVFKEVGRGCLVEECLGLPGGFPDFSGTVISFKNVGGRKWETDFYPVHWYWEELRSPHEGGKTPA